MKNVLMVNKVQGAEFLPTSLELEAFNIEQPKNDQMLVDGHLIIAGWVIGKTSFAEKIVVSGGVNTITPVDMHRPVVCDRLGDRIKDLCPLIHGTPRCGFLIQIPLDPINYTGAPIKVAAVLQNGRKIQLVVITFSKEKVFQSKSDKPFYYFSYKDKGEGYFLRSCKELSKAYPSAEWPNLTATPLPKEREKTVGHYNVFMPITGGQPFMDTFPSIIEQLPQYMIEDLNNKTCSLILDHSNEAAILKLCILIHDELQNHGIHDFSNVHLITQNRLLCEAFTDFNVHPFDYWVIYPAIMLHKQLDEAGAWDSQLHTSWKYGKVKNILCMNNVGRLHRWLTVATLIKKGMLTGSLVSFLGELKSSGAKGHQDVLKFAARTESLQNLNEAINWLAQNAPLRINEYTETRQELLYDNINLSLYEQTIMSVVTESDVHPSMQRITEKSIKAFALGLPSVIVGSRYSVKLVEEMGFDVFHDFIDHSYDQMEDWVQRMNAAIDQAITFCEAWRSGSIDIDKVQAISQKNRDWLREGFFEHYAKRYAFPILSSLANKH